MVQRRLFSNQIADAIIQRLIDKNNQLGSETIPTVAKGNINLLPAPDKLADYLPAIIIEVEDVFNIEATPSKSVLTSIYNFSVKYLQYYNIDNSFEEYSNAVTTSEIIADTLLEDNALQTYLNPYGRILKTEVPHISFSSTETQVFKDLQVPVILVDIQFVVYFRSYDNTR